MKGNRKIEVHNYSNYKSERISHIYFGKIIIRDCLLSPIFNIEGAQILIIKLCCFPPKYPVRKNGIANNGG